MWMYRLAWPLIAQQAPQRGNGDGGFSLFQSPLPLFILLGVLAYIMLFRPERKQRSQREGMLKALKKNDRVVTIGGIYGTVVNAPEGSEDVVLRVDEGSNVRVRVQRSAIARVVDGKSDSETKASAEKS